VSEKRLLRLSETKVEEVVRSWRIPHNEELHKLHSSNILRVIIKKMRWAGDNLCLE
jgi:hypothetical protein